MVSGSKKNSRVKNKGKQKLVLAKDNKQLVTAIVVVAIFLINTVIMLVKAYQEEHPTIVATNTDSQLPPNTLDPTTAATTDPANGQPQTVEAGVNNETGINSTTNLAQNAPSTTAQDANKIYSQTVNLQNKMQLPKIANTASSENDIEIIPQKIINKKSAKMVSIIVDNTGRENPFLPASGSPIANGIPKILPYLTAPPENLSIDSQAGKVMTTTISGILYDKYSPSAIINIEGSDYLVKKGDVINHYKILSVQPTQVIVQLGKNVYHAGVGELLTQSNLNFNTIANLNKKFGGNDVSINVKKKGY